MFWLTTSCTPDAVATRSSANLSATPPTACAASDASSGMSPPRKPAGSSRPSTTSASVTAGSRAAAAVARRTGVGAARLGTDLEQAELVDAGEAAAAGADLDEIDRWHRDREPRALLEAVHAGDLERVREVGLAVLDEAGLGGGAAHVEAQQAVFAHAAGEPRAGQRACRRAALHEPDREAGGVVGRDHAAVRQHHQHRTAEPGRRQPLLELVEVGADHRHRRRVACGRDHARVLADLRRHLAGDAHRHAELGAQVVGDDALVGGIDVGVEEAHRDRLDLGGRQLGGQRVERGAAGLDDHGARGGDPLVDLERAVARDRRRRELDLQVVHVVAVLVADEQRVAEAVGGDQAGAAGLALDQRVRDQRRGVHDRCRDVARVERPPCRAVRRHRAAPPRAAPRAWSASCRRRPCRWRRRAARDR